MEDQLQRTRMLIGDRALDRLRGCRVAVFGVGGVGGYVCEALARSGIGAIDIIDNDSVSLSNINRQIIALHSTLGRYKVDVMQERIADIAPNIAVKTRRVFFLPENKNDFPFEEYDYIVDAVDTVAAKLGIIERAEETKTPVISCMGAGNKLDPTGFRVADIYKTRYCPLAKVIRRELKKRGIKKLKVVYSEEEAKKPHFKPDEAGRKNADETAAVKKRSTPGSIAFVPSVAGMIAAGEVIRDLTMD